MKITLRLIHLIFFPSHIFLVHGRILLMAVVNFTINRLEDPVSYTWNAVEANHNFSEIFRFILNAKGSRLP